MGENIQREEWAGYHPTGRYIACCGETVIIDGATVQDARSNFVRQVNAEHCSYGRSMLRRMTIRENPAWVAGAELSP